MTNEKIRGKVLKKKEGDSRGQETAGRLRAFLKNSRGKGLCREQRSFWEHAGRVPRQASGDKG